MAAALAAEEIMPNITYEPVEKYLYELLPPSEPVLREMEAQAAKRDIPIVGPAVARMLYLLGQISGAKRVFEAGSAIGYSTIWWAMAVGEDGRVTYTDGNLKNAEEARGYFQKAGVGKRIDVRVGDALEILSEEKPGSIDIIFNDVDKEDYPRVLKLAVPRLKPGGLFITDNVLWSGRVTKTKNAEPTTAAIQEFNRLLYGSKELFPSIIPLRDGVAVARKL
jgi:caffeoyl-CoA O-methyltransferase